jgi:hypothetical protein
MEQNVDKLVKKRLGTVSYISKNNTSHKARIADDSTTILVENDPILGNNVFQNAKEWADILDSPEKINTLITSQSSLETLPLAPPAPHVQPLPSPPSVPQVQPLPPPPPRPVTPLPPPPPRPVTPLPPLISLPVCDNSCIIDQDSIDTGFGIQQMSQENFLSFSKMPGLNDSVFIKWRHENLHSHGYLGNTDNTDNDLYDCAADNGDFEL